MRPARLKIGVVSTPLKVAEAHETEAHETEAHETN